MIFLQVPSPSSEHPPWIPVIIVPKIQTYLCLLTTKHHIQVFPMLLSMSFVHFVFAYMLTSPFLEQIWWIFFFKFQQLKIDDDFCTKILFWSVIKGVVECCCFYKGKSLLTKSLFDNLNDLRWCHFVLPAYSGPENLKKSRRKKNSWNWIVKSISRNFLFG